MPVPKICSLGLSKGLSGCTKAAGEKGGGRKGEVRGKEREICKPKAVCGNELCFISSQNLGIEMKKQ